MTISYHWLCQYLPAAVFAPTPLVDPDKLGKILTSIGLEVESMETWSRIPGGLQDLVIGEVLTCSKHPDADRLSLTTVNIGQEKPLHIVCGAPNVA
ncbi:MAG TPA: phenylalanine--tRNA ligase subunit beta, partial [Phnomibacter sp.]|nr:phenylalanine--tRNA ligase subunit beta [Phnomibacter sp.]